MKSMYRLALLGTLLGSAASLQAADLKIGFVNTERLYKDAAPSVQIWKKLDKEFGPRDAELKKLLSRGRELESTFVKLPANSPDRKNIERELASVDREYQAKLREYRDDMNQRRNEEFTAIQERANRIIRQIAEREQFDLILQDAVYASPKLDITVKVLKELEK